MSKAYILGFVVGLVLLVAAGVAGSRLQKKDSERVKHEMELAQYRAELTDATPVQFGILTDRQRVHSKLYTQFYSRQTRAKISELVANPKDRVLGIEFHIGVGEVLTEPETPEHYFSDLAEASDVIIHGRVINKTSQLTEDDAFIFTDYNVTVIEILKNNTPKPLQDGETITVTRPGGKIVANGIIVKIKDDAFVPLPLNNHDVVLFLKAIPETGTYRAARDTGSFELDGSILRPLTGIQFPPGVLQDSESFLQTIRIVSTR